ncbi:MAG: YjbQ family protein [Cyanobacteria bacterium SID2]|nr:YjbQ family protein [Cyanobacteria bacterium SID2]MBP0005570.1 YjbQ family protein [Cyanobacteria bacterium SBC]
MPIHHEILHLETDAPIRIYNLTPRITEVLEKTGVRNGQVLVFSRHTTTALAINEYEKRLLDDLEVYLKQLAPPDAKYRHNDLHLRDVPPDEPENAHSHLMAMTLSTSEVIPVVDGQLALGTWQSILFFELDGPRRRAVSVQVTGEL